MSDGRDWGANFASTEMQVYEDVLVPRMFEPWGERLLDELQVATGENVLDIACGPGSVTRLAARRVGPSGSVTGCDLSPSMLAIARSKPQVESAPPISYLECPADALAVGPGSYDVVICQQGLQFFPNRSSSVQEMHRVLRPGGRLGLAVWAEIEACPPFAAIASALQEVLGADIASSYIGGPWGMSHVDELRSLVGVSGFKEVHVEREVIPVVFESGSEQLLSTLGAAPVGRTVAALEPSQQAAILDALQATAESITTNGEIRSEMTSNVAIAVA